MTLSVLINRNPKNNKRKKNQMMIMSVQVVKIRSQNVRLLIPNLIAPMKWLGSSCKSKVLYWGELMAY